MKYKNSAKGFLIVSILFFIISIMGCIALGKWLLPPVNIYNDKYDWSKLPEGRRVNVSANFILDAYEREGYGYSYDVYRKYVVPRLVYSDEEWIDITQYMSVKALKKDFDKYDAVTDNSFAWLADTTGTVSLENGNKVKIKGEIKKMDDKDLLYFRNYLTDIGYGISEANQMASPYYIDSSTDKKLFSFFVLVGFGITTIMALIALILYRKAKKLSVKDAKSESDTTSESDESSDSDTANESDTSSEF